MSKVLFAAAVGSAMLLSGCSGSDDDAKPIEEATAVAAPVVDASGAVSTDAGTATSAADASAAGSAKPR